MIPIISYTTAQTPDRLAAILSRGETASASVRASVEEILSAVKKRGDPAIVGYTKKFDRASLSPAQFRVEPGECAAALNGLDLKLRTALEQAADNVRRFHDHQKRTSWFVEDGDGVILGKRYLPLDSVGLYVPGGTAPLFSTVLMAAIPAKVAGVGRIVMCSPPDPAGLVDRTMLAAAALVGVDEVYRIGGVMAIGAMACGTQTVRPVDKIVGPGNAYVQEAKKQVVGTVGIDLIAGPSEVVVIADETADPAFVAADMLSQAEHGSGMEAAVAVVTSERLANDIEAELDRQAAALPRQDTVRAALDRYGTIFVVPNLATACELTDRIAPEHVELHTADPWALLDQIHHAGAVFLGSASPEPVGDYFAGTNHILPTGRSARYASSLSVDDFVKSSSIVAYSAERLKKTAEQIAALAEAEGLQAHAAAVRKRMAEL
jgi:histidinol dehydrogenase